MNCHYIHSFGGVIWRGNPLLLTCRSGDLRSIHMLSIVVIVVVVFVFFYLSKRAESPALKRPRVMVGLKARVNPRSLNPGKTCQATSIGALKVRHLISPSQP